MRKIKSLTNRSNECYARVRNCLFVLYCIRTGTMLQTYVCYCRTIQFLLWKDETTFINNIFGRCTCGYSLRGIDSFNWGLGIFSRPLCGMSVLWVFWLFLQLLPGTFQNEVSIHVALVGAVMPHCFSFCSCGSDMDKDSRHVGYSCSDGYCGLQE